MKLKKCSVIIAVMFALMLAGSALADNIVRIAQVGIADTTTNTWDVVQVGCSNQVIGVTAAVAGVSDTVVDLTEAAIQDSGGTNTLDIIQVGGNNVIGLYQLALTSNIAVFNQTGGTNSALIWQGGNAVNSFADVTQTGGKTLSITQIQTAAADNLIIVTQQ